MTVVLVVLIAIPLALRVFTREKSTVGTFAVPFRVLIHKNMAGDDVLYKDWYLLGVLFKFSDEHPCLMCMEIPHGVVAWPWSGHWAQIERSTLGCVLRQDTSPAVPCRSTH